MDSTGALDLPDIPKSLLVVGGGYIGLELGTVYAALGTQGHGRRDDRRPAARRRPRLGEHPREADRDAICEAVLLEHQGRRHEGRRQDGIAVTFEGEAAGRQGQRADVRSRARVDRPPAELGDSRAGQDAASRSNARGFIEVDAARRTAEPTIYAIGDVAGEPMLAHKASHEARVAVDAIAGQKVAFEPLAIPAVVFTDPEIAWCGLTETEAEKQGREVDGRPVPVGRLGARDHARPHRRHDEARHRSGDRAHPRRRHRRAGRRRADSEGVLAIEMGANAEDLAMTIHPHPTLSETLMESAEVFFGQSTHVFKPKRK